MAPSRLLQPKPNLPICIIRFSTQKVGFCSSVCSTSDSGYIPHSKKDAAAEENREITVEPLLNESPEIKPDIASKAASARKETGAPGYSLIDVVHILKDKMFGIKQPQKCYAIDASATDYTASAVILSNDIPVHGSDDLQHSEAMTKCQNDVIFSDKSIGISHGKSCMAVEVYDEEVNPTLGVNQVLNFPQAAETEDVDAFNTKSMYTSPGLSSLSSDEIYHEKASRLKDSELVLEETEFLKADKLSSPIFSDLEDLILNPENSSSLQHPTTSLNSTECVKVEKEEIIIGNISIDLGSERGALPAVYDGSNKTIRLVDLFRKQNQDQISMEAKAEQTDYEEVLSDLLLKFQRKTASRNKYSSPINYLLPEAANYDSEDDHLKEIHFIEHEKNQQEDKNLRFEGDETSSISFGTQNIFDSKDLDMKSVNDQIVDENLIPRSLTFTQFEHSNEPREVDAEKLSEIKDLIDFIKFEEGVPSTTTNDPGDTGRISENPSNSISQRFVCNDWLIASEVTTEKSRIDEKTSDLDFQSLGGTELKSSFKILNQTMQTDEEELRNSVLSNSSNSNSPNFLESGRSISTDFTSVKSTNEDEERIDLAFGSVGCTELKANMEISNPTNKTDRGKMENTFLSSKESNDHRVVVRFLCNDTTKDNILETFKRCGAISKVEIPDADGPFFKTAYIHFKTRKGLQRAINERDLAVRNGVVIVQSATSKKKLTGKIPVPYLISDPDVPTVLIKNPSRTVKIQHLTCDIRSHHIKDALSFCESNVSGYILGSTSSVAFVEFETEIGKERALLKHSIIVLGKQLAVLRIDAPRTTVVRVSCIKSIPWQDIVSICRSFGKVRSPLSRDRGILDVHYELAEWPNMCNILNRLNGVEVDGTRLRAEPAHIFPPDILLALWHQPNERKFLKSTAVALLQKLGKNMRCVAELDYLQKFVEDII